jgi:protein-disulfide isomerase/uncharacterized membrane protein
LLTQPAYTSICDVSVSLSCSQAYLSRYGSLGGVPVAILGVVFFAVVLALVGLAPGAQPVQPGKKGRPAETANAAADGVPAYVLALSAVGLLFALYLAWASWFKIGAICLLCSTTYVAVAGLFVVSWRATSFPLTTLPDRARRDAPALAKSPVALAAIVATLAAASLVVAAFPHEATGDHQQTASPAYPPLADVERAQFEKWYDLQPVVEVPIEKGGAKVLIVKFNDFQCPPCRLTYYNYAGILSRYTAAGTVKFVLKHFPLELECNTLNAGHTAACEAAGAFVMAGKIGSAEKLEAWFFANQGPPLLTPDQVRTAAATVGGIKDFESQYATALNDVKADVALGTRLGVKSTPTFFINGRLIAGGLPPAVLEAAIELELKRAGK